MKKIEKETLKVKCSNPNHIEEFDIIVPKDFNFSTYTCPKCKNGKLTVVKGGK